MGCSEPIYGRDLPAAETNLCIVRAEEKLIWFPLNLEWPINQKEFLKQTGGYYTVVMNGTWVCLVRKQCFCPPGSPSSILWVLNDPGSAASRVCLSLRSESDMSHVYGNVSLGIKTAKIYPHVFTALRCLRYCTLRFRTKQSGLKSWSFPVISNLWIIHVT